jgi:hypothetical protein
MGHFLNKIVNLLASTILSALKREPLCMYTSKLCFAAWASCIPAQLALGSSFCSCPLMYSGALTKTNFENERLPAMLF